jgi:hypothetical protein
MNRPPPAPIFSRSQARVVSNLLRPLSACSAHHAQAGFDMDHRLLRGHYDPVFNTMIPWEC